MKDYLSNFKHRILAGIILIGIVLLIAGSSSCSQKIEPIILGLGSSAPTFAPIYIAQSQGFFTRNGLNVTIKGYASGQASVQGLLNGEVDMAGTAEYPMVTCAFNKNTISVFVTEDKALSFYITSRKDQEIENIPDLKGKQIGLSSGTIAEFYLGRFLELNGLQMNDVNIVNVSQAAAMDAINGGKVDAVVVSQPYSYDIQQSLGANGIFWPAQSSQPLFANLASKNDWIAAHPKLVVQFLRALVQAEDFIFDHPADAQAIQKNLLNNVDDEFLMENWPVQQFSLSLDQSLITAMEDEARWMIANNLTTEKTVPDFGNYIYEDALKTVQPEAVNLIR